MPIEFVARVVGVDDEYCLVAVVAEREDGTGRVLMLQAGHEAPDEQEVRLGMDSASIKTLRESLGRILTYGRLDARPAALRR
ncbi:hypothetical protein [Winogradskya humida]|uniref:Uncharacterized protein n=1 Tax=Winogradskya humida TaxID=113566 RepID=A0ABQ4A1U9_9ACTN|nr:hypothetical protein [Actinoplanes humidus]GIE24684.1 hypothetical protein Ahu01nite_077860 [Actinoplanes humidus]